MSSSLRVGRPSFDVTLAHDTNATTASELVDEDKLNGILRQVIVTTPDTVDSSATVTVNILDVDGNTVYTKDTLAADSTTLDLLAADAQVPISGDITVQVVFSADQTADRITKVVLLVDRG